MTLAEMAKAKRAYEELMELMRQNPGVDLDVLLLRKSGAKVNAEWKLLTQLLGKWAEGQQCQFPSAADQRPFSFSGGGDGQIQVGPPK